MHVYVCIGFSPLRSPPFFFWRLVIIMTLKCGCFLYQASCCLSHGGVWIHILHFSILLNSDVCVNFCNVGISSSAEKDLLPLPSFSLPLFLPPHLFFIWEKALWLGVTAPDRWIYSDIKTRQLTRCLCIMGIVLKLITGKLKLHLLREYILSIE